MSKFITTLLIATAFAASCKTVNKSQLQGDRAALGAEVPYHKTAEGRQAIYRLNGRNLDGKLDESVFKDPDASDRSKFQAALTLTKESVPIARASFLKAYGRYLDFIKTTIDGVDLKSPLLAKYRVKVFLSTKEYDPRTLLPKDRNDYLAQYKAKSADFKARSDALEKLDVTEKDDQKRLSKSCGGAVQNNTPYVLYQLNVREEPTMSRTFLGLASLGIFDQSSVFLAFGKSSVVRIGFPERDQGGGQMRSPFDIVANFGQNTQQAAIAKPSKIDVSKDDLSDPRGTSQAEVLSRLQKTEIGGLIFMATNPSGTAGSRVFGVFDVGFDTQKSVQQSVEDGVQANQFSPVIFGSQIESKGFDWGTVDPYLTSSRAVGLNPFVECVEISHEGFEEYFGPQGPAGYSIPQR